MYGLKEAGCVASQNLVNNLAPFRYEPILYTSILWHHGTRYTTFTLAVDDFIINYFNQDYLKYLINSLETHYTISIDHTGAHYCGLQMDWNYSKKYVDISMPGYIVKALYKFQHPAPKKPQYAPHAWLPPKYVQNIQYAHPPETLPVLNKKRYQKSPIYQWHFSILHKSYRSYYDSYS